MKTNTLKKIFKILVILILTILIGVIVHTVRNFIIVSDLEKKIALYESSTNLNLKSINNYSNMRMNYYKKGDKELSIVERISNGNILKISYYKDENGIDQFVDDIENDKKILIKNTTGIFKPKIENCLVTENTLQKIFACFCANIKEAEYNGRKCYIINNFTSPAYLYSKGKNEFYIEKDTGLILRKEVGSPIQIIECEYEFGNVRDDVFIKPDMTEYEIEN